MSTMTCVWNTYFCILLGWCTVHSDGDYGMMCVWGVCVCVCVCVCVLHVIVLAEFEDQSGHFKDKLKVCVPLISTNRITVTSHLPGYYTCKVETEEGRQAVYV